MEIGPFEIGLGQALALLSPAMIVAALAGWLSIATGIAGRVAMYFEDFRNLRTGSAVEPGTR